ncbi:MAG TPA: acetyl-CoA decarbonylase/synthase complex subunit gamma [Candidatus Omnitrophica bacterium]|nr:acetyl-CoA decarbonylase/synthase complex subunit gamma [Candidatus Omnitrophota bacterium]
MALSGLDIYKLLPKTNCKKCGFQTCLAFAMQLAKKAVLIDKCPFVSDDVRATLEEASLAAIRLVQIGTGENKVSTGNETVMFRHEEKFHHPTAIGFLLDDDMGSDKLSIALDEISKLNFERVGQAINVNLIALRQRSGDDGFLKAVSEVKRSSTLGLVLMPATAEALKGALEICAEARPLVYCPKPALLDGFAAVCFRMRLPLAFRAKDMGEFSAQVKRLTQQGLTDIVLDIAEYPVSERLWQLTQARRLAIKKSERSVGFPTMAIVETEDTSQAVCQAAGFIAKYAGIVLLKFRRPEHILPLLTLRQNIFTDPQKPLQVEPNVYPVGAAGAGSPVLVTTNFSLTYYTVLGEIEASRVPSHLICVDTEGMSVLTAWAAEKFTPDHITDTMTRFKLGDIVRHKNLIIPGYVAMMSGDLEEKSGWRIYVGPREASGLPAYLKNLPHE